MLCYSRKVENLPLSGNDKEFTFIKRESHQYGLCELKFTAS